MEKDIAVNELLRLVNEYVNSEQEKNELICIINNRGVSATKGIVYRIDDKKYKEFSPEDRKTLRKIFNNYV
jgi:hypothetical protein